MAFNYADFVPESHRQAFGWDYLTVEEKERLGKFAHYMYCLGQHVVSEIDEIKYDGRLVILEDASRWEVDSLDASTAEFWSMLDKVVVIDGEMFNIENAEKVTVTEET